MERCQTLNPKPYTTIPKPQYRIFELNACWFKTYPEDHPVCDNTAVGSHVYGDGSIANVVWFMFVTTTTIGY